MSEWKDYRLGELIEMRNGFAFKSGDFIDSGVPVIKIKNVKPNKILLDTLSYVSEEVAKGKDDFLIRSNDILITMSGNRSDGSPDSWVGKVSIFRQKGRYLLNQRVSIIRVNENIASTAYVAYNLSSWETQVNLINQANSSGGQANISPDIVKALEISLPSLEEQKSIAEILSSLDDKIDLLHCQNKTLEQLAETLFRQWFVEEAEEGWKETSLYDCIELIGGGTPKTSVPEFWNGDVKWLAGGDIASSHKGFATITEKTITELGLKNSSAKLLPEFATVISARGTVGKYCLLAEPMAFSQSNYGIVPKVDNCFFFTYLLLAHSVDELQAAAYGSVFDTITTNTFKEHQVKLPDGPSIQEFEKSITPYFRKIKSNTIQIKTLQQLRDTLLPKLMSGEVRVKTK